jgi:hypothetical protein
MLSSTCHYAVVNTVHSVIFVPRDSGVKRFLYAWFTHLYPCICAFVYCLTLIVLDSWLSTACLTQARAGAGSTASWLGLPLVGEAQGFHYLSPIYIYTHTHTLHLKDTTRASTASPCPRLFPARLPLPPHPTRVCVPRRPPSAPPVAHRHQRSRSPDHHHRPPPRPRAPKTLAGASDSPENLLHLTLAAPSHARAWKQHASPPPCRSPHTRAGTSSRRPRSRAGHDHQFQPCPPVSASTRPATHPFAMPTTPCPYDDGRPTEAAPPCRPLRCLPPHQAQPTDRRRRASGRRGRSRRQPDPVSGSMPLPLHSLPNVARAASPILCMSPPSPTSAARPPRREPS